LAFCQLEGKATPWVGATSCGSMCLVMLRKGRMLACGTNRRLMVGRACPLCPGISDINLFGYCPGVIYFDAQVSDRAFDLGMPKQNLNGPEISCPPIDQGSFCASQRMGPKQTRVQSNAPGPLRNKASIPEQ
jgi:hypothetical protein